MGAPQGLTQPAAAHQIKSVASQPVAALVMLGSDALKTGLTKPSSQRGKGCAPWIVRR